MRLSVKTTCCEYLTCDMRNVFVNISYFLGRRRRESISHFFVCFAFRPYEDRLRTLLLLLQLVVGQSRFHGGLVRDAWVQRYGLKNRSLLWSECNLWKNITRIVKKRHVCMCRKSQVISGVCVSGKGIGKALMSKVAQVSETSIHHLTLTVKKWKRVVEVEPRAFSPVP